LSLVLAWDREGSLRLLVEQTIQAELHIPDDKLGSEEDIKT
jgi:hypothetical protein